MKTKTGFSLFRRAISACQIHLLKASVVGICLVFGQLVFATPAASTHKPVSFIYHWQAPTGVLPSGKAAHINQTHRIEVEPALLDLVDDEMLNHLAITYKILLVDSDTGAWTQAQALAIAETLRSIPGSVDWVDKKAGLSRWLLENTHLEGDIQLGAERTRVNVSIAAFTHARPRLAFVDGRQGVYYSKRIRRALVRFVTNNGTDLAAYEKILNKRYGITTIVPDYQTLTGETTRETAGRFQVFHRQEILAIMDMFEEMPRNMHIQTELIYLVRRLDGTPHPLHTNAPAVAWTDNGYIEFMDTAFLAVNAEYVNRLVIHEKAHFLWDHYFKPSVKTAWADLGGWKKDPAYADRWVSGQQTEFVSAYAHLSNPNEDLAESIAYFVINPDKLRSRAYDKYQFIRDQIMNKNSYLSITREDLTFNVEDLNPDYLYPGKIARLDIEVRGDPYETKNIKVEIELFAEATGFTLAQSAYLRVTSELGTYTDLYLNPVDEQGSAVDHESHILQGNFTLSRFVKSGYWQTAQIIITDKAGNQRMQGPADFGWQLLVDNVLEDIHAPEYVAGTANLRQSTQVIEGQDVQVIHASWQVSEDNVMRAASACYATMNDEFEETYRQENWGQYNVDNGLCEVNFIMPHYKPTSVYRLTYIAMHDEAHNAAGTTFSEGNSQDELPQKIALLTENPDMHSPEINLDNIMVVAQPINPVLPNGETRVTISFQARDDISGFKIALLNLKDPQGINHPFYVNNGSRSLFASDGTNESREYVRTIILPVGSVPGTWSMPNMTVFDRAGNFKGYDFTETIHFDIVSG